MFDVVAYARDCKLRARVRDHAVGISHASNHLTDREKQCIPQRSGHCACRIRDASLPPTSERKSIELHKLRDLIKLNFSRTTNPE